MPDFEKIAGKSIGRRAFVAATTASLASLALAGCQPQDNALEESENAPAAFETEGKWIPAACWYNCGGKCYNAAYVIDGVVKYQKTDDVHEDSMELPQMRCCPRGRSLRHFVYAPDRIKYPMKRKSWTPENPNGELRGTDEWERISWDEAIDLACRGLKQAIDNYGNRSILVTNWAFSSANWLAALGGYTETWDTGSFGAWMNTASVFGIPSFGDNKVTANDRMDLVNSETVVLYGCNPSWASPGVPSAILNDAKEKGVSFVFVGPSYNATADLLDARWIPVRPATDTAFMLAVIYEMMAMDDPSSNPIVAWDFLDRYTVGFDMEHLPETAATQECFKDYLLGKYDGIEKTAEWASEICGTPVEDIRWFAEAIGCTHDVALMHSYAAGRNNDADDVPQLFLTMGLVGGHVGRPGNCTGSIYLPFAANAGAPLVTGGATGAQNAIPNPVDDCMVGPHVWRGILEEKYRSYHPMFRPGWSEDRDIHISVIYNELRNPIGTYMAERDAIEAYRKVDMCLFEGCEFNATAQYSDLLLPTTTQWERFSSYDYLTTTNRELQLFPSKVIEPLGEAKDVEWVHSEMLKKFGVDPLTVFPISPEQGYFNFVAGATVVTDDGTGMEPLVTITQEDLDELGFEGTPQEGRIAYKELMEQGKYQVPRKSGDNFGHIAYKAFIEDPEANPLATASGKFEIYSQAKVDILNAFAPDAFKPYPTYHRPLHGYEDSFSDWENKVKGEYPYQMYNPHYLRRAHTAFDSVPQLREVWESPVFVNASDAKEKGVATGDIVRVYNGYGSCLRTVSVTERVMPGCMALPHGSWMRLDADTGIDHGGSDNAMLAPDLSGAGISGYNTNLVNFEKYSGDDFLHDYEVELKPAGGIN